MVWFKVCDSLASHSKPRRARLEAMGLWTVCGAWSADQLQDGRVADWYVESWPKGRALAGRLVKAGLWHAPGHDCPDCPQIDEGWTFHQFDERNPLAAQVKAERKAAADRQRRARDAAKSRRTNADRHAVTDAVTNAEVTPPVTPESRRESRSPRPDPKGGSVVGREAYESDAPARDDAAPAPRYRCPEHASTLNPPPCRACARAREAAEAYDAEQKRARAEAEVAERRRGAEARSQAAARCVLCDAEGRLPGGAVCSHDMNRQQRNKRGIDGIREQLTNRQKERESA